MKRPELYQALRNLEFDAPQAVRTFAMRLAEEQGWTREFTRCAIEEYRRFLYLAAVCDHQVTPSKAVDEVWHLHLLYTRSYWEDWCGTILRRPLHHDPSSGGIEEDVRHATQYDATRLAYTAEFGHPPPAQIWGHPKPSSTTGKNTRLARAALVLGAGVLLIIFTGGAAQESYSVEDFGIFLAVVLIVVVVIMLLLKLVHREQQGKCSTSGRCGAGCGTGGTHLGGGCGDQGGDAGGDGGGSGCGGGGCGGGD